jgi:indole-3-glycerol phosphate synthase
MTILDQIIARKHKEVEEKKSGYPVKELEKSLFMQRKTDSLRTSLLREDLFGIIAEFKRRSPSAGVMNSKCSPEIVCQEYIRSGCSGLSILTDPGFFGGSIDDLTVVRWSNDIPILRKDFIIDEYQIVEARSAGADAILLIAELHEARTLENLYRFARSLDLEVLVEIHDEKNISRIPYDAHIVGINSRNLSSLKVSPENHELIISKLPPNVVKVAESGIRSVQDYVSLKNAGFDAFLIGEMFMNSPDPGKSCTSFISQIKQLAATSLSQDKML